jgi:hypothetical protein
LFSVAHLHYEDQENFIPNLVNGAIVLTRTHIDAVKLLLGLHLLDPRGAGVVFEAENVPVHLLSDVRIEPADIPLSGGGDFNPVGQVSVPQFPHEVT